MTQISRNGVMIDTPEICPARGSILPPAWQSRAKLFLENDRPHRPRQYGGSSLAALGTSLLPFLAGSSLLQFQTGLATSTIGAKRATPDVSLLDTPRTSVGHRTPRPASRALTTPTRAHTRPLPYGTPSPKPETRPAGAFYFCVCAGPPHSGLAAAPPIPRTATDFLVTIDRGRDRPLPRTAAWSYQTGRRGRFICSAAALHAAPGPYWLPNSLMKGHALASPRGLRCIINEPAYKTQSSHTAQRALTIDSATAPLPVPEPRISAVSRVHDHA
ncbi:hypothetical protein DFH11DRAFT_1724883 [Phellopilus nigrolimitatus]|nr:hypothetical protein DFH11DRAFT_1724883 [Phellopilus nigrolimitatus]